MCAKNIDDVVRKANYRQASCCKNCDNFQYTYDERTGEDVISCAWLEQEGFSGEEASVQEDDVCDNYK